MIRLAEIALKGPVAAATVSTGLLLIGLVLPLLAGPAGVFLTLPLIWASGAVVAFVLLRRGPGHAIYGVAAALALMLILSVFNPGSLFQLFAVVVQFWLPSLLVAYVLRQSVSLSIAVLAGGAIGLFTLLFQHLVFGDPAVFWERVLTEQIDASVAAAATDQPADPKVQAQIEAFRSSVGVMAKLAAPMSAMMMLITGVTAVFLARAWQARLFNPGGFQVEFHSLWLGKKIAIGVLVITALSMVWPASLLTNVVIVVMAVMMFQGIAVVHALVKIRGMSSGWIVGLYLLLMMPHTSALVGAMGIADNWLNFRRLTPGSTNTDAAGADDKDANAGSDESDTSGVGDDDHAASAGDGQHESGDNRRDD